MRRSSSLPSRENESRLSKLVVALALLAALHGLQFGTFTASGADSYGYVSQADLWLQRTLIIDQPLHDEFSWRWANWTLAPLGYRPGEMGGSMVPVYGPGLPLLMALFKVIGGDMAVSFVVPLMSALAIWLTYLLALRFGDRQVAALTALALPVRATATASRRTALTIGCAGTPGHSTALLCKIASCLS